MRLQRTLLSLSTAILCQQSSLVSPLLETSAPQTASLLNLLSPEVLNWRNYALFICAGFCTYLSFTTNEQSLRNRLLCTRVISCTGIISQWLAVGQLRHR